MLVIIAALFAFAAPGVAQAQSDPVPAPNVVEVQNVDSDTLVPPADLKTLPKKVDGVTLCWMSAADTPDTKSESDQLPAEASDENCHVGKGKSIAKRTGKKPVASASFVPGQPFYCDRAAWIASWTAPQIYRCSFTWAAQYSLFMCTDGGRYAQSSEALINGNYGRGVVHHGGCNNSYGIGDAWTHWKVY